MLPCRLLKLSTLCHYCKSSQVEGLPGFLIVLIWILAISAAPCTYLHLRQYDVTSQCTSQPSFPPSSTGAEVDHLQSPDTDPRNPIHCHLGSGKNLLVGRVVPGCTRILPMVRLLREVSLRLACKISHMTDR